MVMSGGRDRPQSKGETGPIDPQGDLGLRSADQAPPLIRHLSSDFGLRHTKGVAITRWLVMSLLVILGSVFCALGYWWGAWLYIGAAANGLLAYLMPHWKTALEAESRQRVHELERSRAHVVDDAAARLRRIEQNLHDGAQAQMVAVVMKLGLAKEHLEGADAMNRNANLIRVAELVDAAHRGAQDAISDLRNLAHGIHPPILDEGLGAALSALAARCDIPVELVVDLSERPSPAIETIAYFCAAELLTNVVKHSAARRVVVEARCGPSLVRVRICDDGVGGASIGGGGGLAGLAERIATVDGKLEVESPPGGPTEVAFELPLHA